MPKLPKGDYFLFLSFCCTSEAAFKFCVMHPLSLKTSIEDLTQKHRRLVELFTPLANLCFHLTFSSPLGGEKKIAELYTYSK